MTAQIPLFTHPEARLTVPAPLERPDLGPVSVTVETACRVTFRDRRTVCRWRKAGKIPDPLALSALQAFAYGLLPSPRWKGWHLTPGGALDHPALRRALDPHEAEQVAFTLALLRAERDAARQEAASARAALQDHLDRPRAPVVALRRVQRQQGGNDRLPGAEAGPALPDAL